MEVSKPRYALTLALVAVLAFAVGYVFNNYPFSHDPHQPMTAKANVFITIQTEMGTYDLAKHNLITDYGENATGLGTFGFACNASWIALGNSTIEQTKTKLDSEYTRAVADSITIWISNGDYAINVTKKFTFTETVTLNATALHCSEIANANDAWAMASFTQTQFEANWNLTITWARVFNGN